MATPNYARITLVLGLLSAVGPFAIDMYIPALPTIVADLNASTAAAQATFTSYFAVFAIFQLVYGPLSDVTGRKPPMIFGLVCFVIGSLCCMFAPNIELLIAGRAIQGLGASALLVVSRAVIRDLHTGIAAARMMALVMLIFGVSPMLAPLGGSIVMALAGWRAIFGFVALFAVFIVVVLLAFLPETRYPHQRHGINFGTVIAGFGALLRDRRFLGLAFLCGLGSSSFFAFLSSSAFVYIEHFGLTPTQYSLVFSFNAFGYFAAAQVAPTLGRRIGLPRVALGGMVANALSMAVLLGLTLLGVDDAVVLSALLFVAFAFQGLVTPTSMVLALDPHGTVPGLAAALAGTIQMLTGGISILIVSAVFDGTPLPMIASIATFGVLGVVLATSTLRREAALPVVHETA